MTDEKKLNLKALADAILGAQAIARGIWGIDKRRIKVCPKCNEEAGYSKHSPNYCPNDGRKLIVEEINKEVWEQTWMAKFKTAAEYTSREMIIRGFDD